MRQNRPAPPQKVRVTAMTTMLQVPMLPRRVRRSSTADGHLNGGERNHPGRFFVSPRKPNDVLDCVGSIDITHCLLYCLRCKSYPNPPHYLLQGAGQGPSYDYVTRGLKPLWEHLAVRQFRRSPMVLMECSVLYTER